MKRYILAAALICFCISGAGCETAKPYANQTKTDDEQAASIHPNPMSEILPTGVEKITFWYSSSTSEYVFLYKIDPKQFTFAIEHTSSAKSIAAWQAALNNPALVANGAYFHEDYSPSGLLISNGERIGSRMFDLDKSAVLDLEPKPRIIDTGIFPVPTDSQHSLQSYPLLIESGRPAIEKDSQLLARRTFFGIDSEENVYVGILPKSELSLFALSEILLQIPVDWETVINLDGGPSSGIAAAGDEIQNSFLPVPNVIVVKGR